MLLRGLWHPRGLQWLDDVLLHDAVPALFVGYSWLRPGIALAPFAARLFWAAWPIAYFLYAMLRGALSGFYPYPFFNAAQLGYGRVLLNAVAILAGYVVIAGILALVERTRRFVARPTPPAADARAGRRAQSGTP